MGEYTAIFPMHLSFRGICGPVNADINFESMGEIKERRLLVRRGITDRKGPHEMVVFGWENIERNRLDSGPPFSVLYTTVIAKISVQQHFILERMYMYAANSLAISSSEDCG